MSRSTWDAVMAVDPGGTTGVSRGVYPRNGSLKSRIRRGKRTRHEQVPIEACTPNVPNAYSDEMAMAYVLSEMWLEFKAEVAPLKPVLVVEGFVLYQGRGHGTMKAEGLYPVRIASSLEAFLYSKAPEGNQPVYQLASEAMGFATNERLKMWGLWHVGLEHARDASRHLATRLAKLGNERPNI